MEERNEPQGAARKPEAGDEMLTISEIAEICRVSKSTAFQLVRSEPDVIRLYRPGGKRPIVRVPRAVLDRILRRSRVH